MAVVIEEDSEEPVVVELIGSEIGFENFHLDSSSWRQSGRSIGEDL